MLNPAGLYDRVLDRMSRRDLLKLASFLGVGLIRPAAARGGQAPMYFNAYPFTMGVASGDPLPDGVVLWTRLAPRPLEGGGMPMVPVPVQWELGRDAAFRTIAQKGEALARPELGHSVHVEVNGLEPGHEYLVSIPRRQRGQPDRPDQDRAGGRGRGESAAVRRLRLQPFRDRSLHRLPADRPGAIRLRHSHRGLHLRVARRRWPDRRARPPAPGGRDLHAGRLPQSLCAVQVGS